MLGLSQLGRMGVSTVANALEVVLTLSGGATTDEGSVYTLNILGLGEAVPEVTSLTVDWGDGSAVENAVFGDNTHAYADGDNNYTIRVTAVHPDGTKVSTMNLQVDNVDPEVILSGLPTATVGLPYTLLIGDVFDPGGDTVNNFRIYWGDGDYDDYSSPGEVTHVYLVASASVDITVDLTDEDGSYTSVDTLTIQVLAGLVEQFTTGSIGATGDYARSGDTAEVTDHEGVRRSIPAGAAGFNGLRVVQNLRGNTLTTQSITVVSGREYQVTIAGTNGATCVASNAFTGMLTADGVNRISWPNGTPKTAASTTLTLTITGTLTDLQVEDVTGASNQAPSEGITVGVGTGPELVTNGGFDSGYTGWGIVNTPDIVVNGGVVTIANSGAEYGGLYYEFATVVGRAYVVHVDITDVGSGDALVRAYAGAGNYNSGIVQVTKTSAAHVTLYFVATNATSGVRIGLGTNIDGNNATFDNVSIKECDPGNIGADGFAYKATTNGNTVDGNGVVTEGTGDPIYGGRLVMGPAITRINNSDYTTWNKNPAGINLSVSGTIAGRDRILITNSTAVWNRANFLFQNVLGATSMIVFEGEEGDPCRLSIEGVDAGGTTMTVSFTIGASGLSWSAQPTVGTLTESLVEEFEPGIFRYWFKFAPANAAHRYSIGLGTGTAVAGDILHISKSPYVYNGSVPMEYPIGTGTAVAKPAPTLSYPITVPQSAGMAVIELAKSLSSTSPAAHGLLSFDSASDVGPIYRTASSTDVTAGDGTNTTSVALGAAAQAIGVRWTGSVLQIGVRDADDWTWAAEGTYDGAFTETDLAVLCRTIAEITEILSIALYAQDEGTAWFVANHPPREIPEVIFSRVTEDGDQIQIGFSLPMSGRIVVSLTADATPNALSGESWNTTRTVVTFDVASTIDQTAVCVLSHEWSHLIGSSHEPLQAFADISVSNQSTVDTTPPVVLSSGVNAAGTKYTIVFDGPMNQSNTTGQSITVDAAGDSLSNPVWDNAYTLTFDVATPIYKDQVVLRSYSPGNMEDTSANSLAGYSDVAVNNGSTVPTPDVTAPTITSASLGTDGTTLTLGADENCTGLVGFTLRRSAGSQIAVSALGLADDTWTGTAAQVFNGETVVLDYAPGNVQDLAGNPLAAFTGMAVTNNSTVSQPSSFDEDYSDGTDDSSGTYTRAGNASGLGADGDQDIFAANAERFETRYGEQYTLLEGDGVNLIDSDMTTWTSLGDAVASVSSTIGGQEAYNITGQTAAWHRMQAISGAQSGTRAFRVVLAQGADGGGVRNQAQVRWQNNSQGNNSAWANIVLGSNPTIQQSMVGDTLTFLRKYERKTGEWEYDFSFAVGVDGNVISLGVGTGTAVAADSIRGAMSQLEAGTEPTSWMPDGSRNGDLPASTGGLQYTVADIEGDPTSAWVVSADGVVSEVTDGSMHTYDAGTDVLKLGGTTTTRLQRFAVNPGTQQHTFQTIDPTQDTVSELWLDSPGMGMQYAAKLKEGSGGTFFHARVTNPGVLNYCRDQYIRLPLKAVMPGYDTFYWNVLDAAINEAWAMNPRKTTFICVIMGTPFRDDNEYTESKPQWFIDDLLAGDRGLSSADTSCDYYLTNWRGWVSNDNPVFTNIVQACHESEIFLSMVERFCIGFSAHYGTDEWVPKISGLDIRMVGTWSESHNSNTFVANLAGQDSGLWPMPSWPSYKRVIDAHLAIDPRIHCCANFDNASDYNLPGPNDDHPWNYFATQVAAQERKGAWGQDGTGSTDWEIRTRVQAQVIPDAPTATGWSTACSRAWRRGIVREEPQANEGLTLSGDQGTSLADCILTMRRHHGSLDNNKYSQLYATSTAFRDIMDDYRHNYCGYRLHVEDVSIPDACVVGLQFPVSAVLHNTRQAAFYWDDRMDLCIKFVKSGGGASDVVVPLVGSMMAAVLNEPSTLNGLGTINTAGTWAAHIGLKMKAQYLQSAYSVPLALDDALRSTDGNGMKWYYLGDVTAS